MTIQLKKWRFIALIGFALLAIGSLAKILTQELNYAIDFRGGAIFYLESQDAIEPAALQSSLAKIGFSDASVTRFGSTYYLIVFLAGRTSPADMASGVASLLQRDFPAAKIDRTEIVGPRVAGELISVSLFAIGLSVLGSLSWTWFRFGGRFATVLGLAQMFEGSQVVGFFTVTQLPFGIPGALFLALLLVMSLIQKLIVFKSINRNPGEGQLTGLGEAVDRGVNESLMRMLLVTLAIAGLLGILGGVSIVSLFGVVITTLSTIFLAPSLLLTLWPGRYATMPIPGRSLG